MTLPDALAEVDAIFERFAALQRAPGVAYGVMLDGELVHTRGLGTARVGIEAAPDQDSIFRIASMTKSFTAAAVLLLRDEGRLRLDDRVATWVPEVAELDGPTADAPPITIEHLLTMAAGLPTDDPWGDRQQGLDLGRFAAFLREGPSRAWPTGTRFEYSNLGYGILGRVVSNVAGSEYREFVRERLLVPLGMAATTFLPEEVPSDRLALGYVRRDGTWLEEPIDPYGALAAMGGVLTSLRDLARWVAGFTDAYPPREEPEGSHPLTRATRREMQEVQRSIDPKLTWVSVDQPPTLAAGGYGYGLFVSDDLRVGRVVGHGGGYPGYGSHMRWHPSSGIGVLALTNGRYAPVGRPAGDAVTALVVRETTRTRRLIMWPATLQARSAVERLLDHWDDAVAADLFAMNVELDEPLVLRRATIERLHETHGTLRTDDTVEPVCRSPASLAWWMAGERGRVKVEILLDPERPPRVQALTLTSVPQPSSGLASIARRLAALLGESGPAWPPDVAMAASADRAAIERGLRAAEARYGPVTLGPPVAGDGETDATWRLSGDRGELDLRLELDAPGGAVTMVSFVPLPMETPVHAI